MSEKNKTTDTRRRLLKGAIASSAAGVTATQWAKPVIGSVVLPAHAETSGTGGDGTGGNTTPTPTPSPSAKIWASGLAFADAGNGEEIYTPIEHSSESSLLAAIKSNATDLLIPSAYAGESTTPSPTTVPPTTVPPTTTPAKPPMSIRGFQEYYLEDIGSGQYEFHCLRYSTVNGAVCSSTYISGTLQLNVATVLPILFCGESRGSGSFELIQATEGGQAVVVPGDLPVEAKGFKDIVIEWNPAGTVPSAPPCDRSELCFYILN